MKSIIAITLTLIFSGHAHAALLSCESNDAGESNGSKFVGQISENSRCPSGYALKIRNAKRCVLLSPSARLYTGMVRGCGYDNGSAFVVTALLPFGAE